jgi:hypothetical protein
MTGFEAELEIVGDEGEPLAPWWRFDPAGCRPGWMIAEYPMTSECPDALETYFSGCTICTRFAVTGPPDSSHVVVRIVSAALGPIPALTEGVEYSLFQMRLPHIRTVGAGSCSGCSESVAVVFRSLKITQPTTPPAPSPANLARGSRLASASGDFRIYPNPASSGWIAYSEGVPAGFSSALGVPGHESPAARPRLWFANPMRGAGSVRLELPLAMRCSLGIFDIAGRRRRLLLSGALPAGSRAISWDGRDDGGEVLPSGCYVLRLVGETATLARTIVVLR